ncbi:MAG: hypothetical protein ABL930_04400 [Pseudobdellovibrio sp.]
MKTIHYIYIVGLVATVFFVEYDLTRRTELRENLAQKSQQKEVVSTPVAVTAVPILFDQGENNEIKKKFVAKFKAESLQMAQLQNDPEEVQSRLKLLAKEMSTQDVDGMFEIISDDKKDGDQRALAIELLSLRNDTASLLALQNFVGNSKNINGTKWDRKRELETVLRAQAVESIATFPQKEIAISTLSFLQNKVDEKFLSDRIGRAAASLNNGTPTLQQQDDAALKKLLE